MLTFRSMHCYVQSLTNYDDGTKGPYIFSVRLVHSCLRVRMPSYNLLGITFGIASQRVRPRSSLAHCVCGNFFQCNSLSFPVCEGVCVVYYIHQELVEVVPIDKCCVRIFYTYSYARFPVR